MEARPHIINVPGIQNFLIFFHGAYPMDIPHVFKRIQIRLVRTGLAPKIQFLIIVTQYAYQIQIPFTVPLRLIPA